MTPLPILPPADSPPPRRPGTSTSALRNLGWYHRGATCAVRCYRLLLLILAASLLAMAESQRQSQTVDQELTLAEVQQLFPEAARFGRRDVARQSQLVLSADGTPLGQVLRTSPDTDDLIGYTGSNDVLIGMTPTGSVRGLQLRRSGDTRAHVDAVREASKFWAQFPGWQPEREPLPPVVAVSGSTLTSLTIAEAVQRRLAGVRYSLRFPTAVTLAEAKQAFATAAELKAAESPAGWLKVSDGQQQLLGYLVRTSPLTDALLGYAGPSESLLAIAPDQQTILRIQLRSSYDTAEYVERVVEDSAFWEQLRTWPVAEWANLDFREAGLEGVSGATQTSYAIAEGVRRTMQATATSDNTGTSTTILTTILTTTFPSTGRWQTWGTAAYILGAMAMTFGLGRGRKWLRLLWQILVVVGFGIWLGDLLSISLLVGWSRQANWAAQGGTLAALVAVALLVPWATKQQIYCHQLCPHGIVQEWLGKQKYWRGHLPPTVTRWLQCLPGTLLATAFLLGVWRPEFELAWLEPFDGWSLGVPATASFTLACVSLLIAVVLPQSYCRYGCPTGALLKLVRSHAAPEKFGRAEVWASVILAIAAVGLWWPHWPEETAQSTPATRQAAAAPRWSGEAFGTRWSVRIRDDVSLDTELGTRLTAEMNAEIERIEKQLSHWSAESETTQFNSSATTLELEYSAELIRLVDFARQLHQATAGQYDITIGPLVDAWGHGPSGSRDQPPSDAQIQTLLTHVGLDKLQVFPEFSTLKKSDPELQIDLGSLLHGYAADRLIEVLQTAGVQECLVDVGGEFRAKGSWKVGVESIAANSPLAAQIELKDAALATSGTYRPDSLGRTDAPHLLSPFTGRPVETSRRLCSVIAETGLQADGWATALFLMPTAAAVRLADEQGLSLLLIDADGSTTRSGLFALP